jgi:biopolymer transport protein ExbD
VSDEQPGPEKGERSHASKVEFKAALRRAVRRNAHEPEVNFLNITAMLDIMTIILVFLLKSLAESSSTVPQSDDLRLPTSVLTTEPAQEGIKVTVSKSQITVGNQVVIELPSHEQQVKSGAGAKYKQGGDSDLFLVPLGNSLAEARKVDKAVKQALGENANLAEAVIICDETTPWRLLVEVFVTLGQSEFNKYHLMVLQGRAG